MGTNFNSFSAILDKEIKSADQDKFGHKDLAEALKYLVEDEKHVPPYSIGLLGEWGTGKSSIKEIYLKNLENDAKKDQNGNTRKDLVKAISFNAWRYGGENMRRSLLREAFIALGGRPEQLWDHFFKSVSRTDNEYKDLKQFCLDFGLNTGAMLAQIGLMLLVAYSLLYLFFSLTGITNEMFKTGIMAILTLCLFPAIKYIFDPNRYVISIFNEATKKEMPVSTAMEYENIFISQLIKYKSKNSRLRRLVIFVDDLDRLSAREMVEGLDAVRSFMEMPGILSEIGIVFVISCDESRVAKALEARKNRSGKNGLPAAVLNIKDARRFLDRLFQFRLEIPSPPDADMRSYAQKLIETEYVQISEDMKKHNLQLTTLVHHLIPNSVKSPRNAIQLINAFAQIWWLAKEREHTGAGSSQVGGLRMGSVTNHPRAVAALSVLKVCYPDFYADLQKYPDMLGYFRAILFENKQLEEIPAVIKLELERYIDMVDGDDISIEIKRECDGLKSYLSSIKSLQLPDDMAPLVHLSEDPLSRNLPGGTNRAYKALLANDQNAFLSEIGEANNQDDFNVEILMLIEDLVSQLSNAMEEEVNNAYNVLANIHERIPTSADQQLMRPLVRRVAESTILRNMIGLEKTSEIVIRGGKNDQMQVASKLVKDFCKLSGGVKYSLQSGSKPTLDEVEAGVRKAVEIIVNIGKRTGLLSDTKIQLANWMVNRPILYGESESRIPIGDLETWVENYGDYMLELLDSKYIDAICAEVENNNELLNVNIDKIAINCKTVLNRNLANNNLDIIWEQLKRLVQLEDIQLLEVALAFIESCYKRIEPSALNEIIQSIATEAVDYLNEEVDDFEETNKNIFKLLSNILNSRISELTKESINTVTKLINTAKAQAPIAPHAIAILNKINNRPNHLLDTLIAEWLEIIFSELPILYVSWVAGKTVQFLNENQFNKLYSVLSKVLDGPNITEDAQKRMYAFMKGIPVEQLKSPKIIKIAGKLFEKLIENAQNQNNYIISILPVADLLLDALSDKQIAQLLDTLVTSAADNPQYLGFVHAVLKERWVLPSDEYQNYDLGAYVGSALSILSQHPGEINAPDIIDSMINIKNVSGEDQKINKDILEAITYIWPHHSSQAVRHIKESNLIYPPAFLAGLGNNTNINDLNQTQALRTAYSQQASIPNNKRKKETLTSIINTVKKGNGSNEDIVLDAWCDALVDDAIELVMDVLTNEELNIDQVARLWRQIVKRKEQLKYTFFVDSGPKLLSIENFDGFAAEYFNLLQSVYTKSSSDEQKKIERAHGNGFKEAASLSIKNRIVSWAQKNSGVNVFNVLKNEKLHPNDKEILLRAFPKSSKIKKLKTD